MPRPTVITSKVLSELKTAFSFGSTDKEACIFAGISEKTLYNYQNIKPEFLQQKELWKASIILEARKTVHEAIEKGNAYIALKYLQSKKPDEFTSSHNRKQRSYSQIDQEEISALHRRISGLV